MGEEAFERDYEEDDLGTEDGDERGGDTPEIEQRARRMGWSPKEDFRGDPDKWVDPETYVKRAEEVLPIAKGTIKKLEETVVGMERRLAQQAKTFEEFNEYHKGTAKREYERALETLKKEREEAVVDGDLERFKETEDKIKELDDSHPGVKKADNGDADKPQEEPAGFKAWREANTWFEKDPEMTKFAIRYANGLAAEGTTLKGDDFMEEVTREVKARFPKKFTNPRRDEAAPVGGGAPPGSGGKRGRGYADLPPDAKAACDKYVKDIPGFTKEQYVEEYFRG